ncbi:Histone deacetylase-like amidohydrolase [Pseudobythopirellula maris]|uniref:Histone deacetylase-like amidohydrolase n=1 Tax=Pseudobythopirellula maris TaxID=2527991 RepID=A0A5C5ZNL4_9BACT|nr:histone deacetylase [Pseudobythopirellula maris]TWT88780.1 Histone deacetylase-like amidohydrolase [Pseudobythopirellula maris]
MTLLYYNPQFLNHETGAHPENAGRLRAILGRLEADRLLERCERPPWEAAPSALLTSLHGVDYLASLREMAGRGGGQVDGDTIVSSESLHVAALAAGAACDAARRVVEGEARRALCLVRPPGHHALKDRAMGFCLLGNVALAARYALDELGLDRVLIVDWDVHHGNGTQDLFYEDPRVAFFSMHRFPFWPGSGAEGETGAGDGLGFTKNLPVQFGASQDRQLSWFARELGDFADKVRPQLVIVSAGFDSHRLDPIGGLGLESADFIDLTATVMDVAAAHAGGRLVSVLEGGYHPDALAESVALHLGELLERDADEAADEQRLR